MSGPSSSVGVGPTPNLREGDASTVVAQETWEAISREAISESLAKAAEANEAPAADIEATEPNKETNPAAPPPPPMSPQFGMMPVPQTQEKPVDNVAKLSQLKELMTPVR